ncbi:hypothetical protein [Streptomyces sp. NBC_01077]|uniref:hypothetical protein n=1 Tax=Streptomyces sp. NBC_01077 TaxID=2903746 RepID=UPI003870ACD7
MNAKTSERAVARSGRTRVPISSSSRAQKLSATALSKQVPVRPYASKLHLRGGGEDLEVRLGRILRGDPGRGVDGEGAGPDGGGDGKGPFHISFAAVSSNFPWNRGTLPFTCQRKSPTRAMDLSAKTAYVLANPMYRVCTRPFTTPAAGDSALAEASHQVIRFEPGHAASRKAFVVAPRA